jgi:hypothetical protein
MEKFKDMKKQIIEMLTRNGKSTVNTVSNLRSLNNIICDLNAPSDRYKNNERARSTVYIEDDSGKILGAYFLTHDWQVEAQGCFHIVRIISFFILFLDCLLDFCKWTPDI